MNLFKAVSAGLEKPSRFRFVDPPVYDCETCLDTGLVLSGEDGPSWKMYDPCYACGGKAGDSDAKISL